MQDLENPGSSAVINFDTSLLRTNFMIDEGDSNVLNNSDDEEENGNAN